MILSSQNFNRIIFLIFFRIQQFLQQIYPCQITKKILLIYIYFIFIIIFYFYSHTGLLEKSKISKYFNDPNSIKSSISYIWLLDRSNLFSYGRDFVMMVGSNLFM